MIKQIHLRECDSTQDVLKEQLKENSAASTILVSTNLQRKGRGRGENSWEGLASTLCFSFNVKPHAVASFTALELSVLIVRFFEAKGKSLSLKWPNDIWNQNSLKCCGILVQGSQESYLAGIGLNLFSESSQYGGVYEAPFDFDHEAWSRELAKYILNHRYPSTLELKNDWERRCFHLGKKVVVREGDVANEGIFLGLGEYGEALLQGENEVIKLFNGSLRPSEIR